MMVAQRRWLFILAGLAFCAGVALWFEREATPPPTPSLKGRGEQQPTPSFSSVEHTSAAETAAPESKPEPASRWSRWGGALNSASHDGDGFFDETRAAEFFNETRENNPKLSKYVMRLHSRALLPEKNADAALQPGDQTQSAYLQFEEHPTPEQGAKLAEAGIELESFVTAYAWRARGTPAAFKQVAQWDLVRGVAQIDPRDKLHANVYRERIPGHAALDGQRARLWVLARPGASEEAFSAALKKLPQTANLEAKLAYQSSLGPQFEVAAEPKHFATIAVLEPVSYVEFSPPPAASRDTESDDQHNIQDVRDAGPGLDGTGVSVAVREIGQPEAHVDFAGRLNLVQNGVTTPQSERDHATGVHGIVGGNGTSAPKGVAPNCALLAYAVNDVSGQTFGTGDVIDAAGRGARISNHSYGPSSDLGFGEYRTISADWDNAIRASNLVGFFANYEALTPPSFTTTDYFVGAKNTLCVNSSNSSAHAGDLSPLTAPADGSSTFNGKGTMNDGRVKPDLTAFGDNVALPVGTSGQRNATGTSFSTPTCSGAAALVFQHYRNKVGSDPSAALTKALMCNAATDLGNTGPDAIYGFGLLNVEAAIQTIDQRQSIQVGPFVEGSLANGQNFQFTAMVDGSPQLKATLCWMDPGGTPAAIPALVNNLDLEIVAPDGTTTFFPFSLSAGNPGAAATASAPNTVDPIEQIIINTPANGTYTFTIRGTSIPSGTQPFAVVLNQATLPLPLVAQVLASPTEGEAPLTVAFSAAGSTGNNPTYKWDFGDGTSANGSEVSHTYTTPGTFTASVTLTDIAGKQASGSKVINVKRRSVNVFASKMQVKLNFASSFRSSLSLTLTIPELVMTPQQFRDAQKTGALANKTFTLIVNQQSFPFKTDEKGRVRDSSQSLTQNLTRGQITVQIRNNASLVSLFRGLGMSEDPASTGLKEVPVRLETDEASYRATFKVFYLNRNGKSGSAR
ncbi:MAG TPA: S8 family serine peptidase [Planctomycetota bacterium]|nr:S8 family serine peptidase [Planctomycetota bacterium]